MRKDEFRVQEVVRYEVRHTMSDARFAGSDSIGLFHSAKTANKVAALMVSATPGSTLIQSPPDLGWFSTEDVQPNPEIDVLVCSIREYGGVYFDVAAIFGGFWKDRTGRPCEVTHWLPIPPAPQ